MARIRTIKPEFWAHEELSELPEATHMLAAALLNHADDYGYFNANPKLVAAICCPLREPSVSVPESLRSLQEIGYIDLGTGPGGKRYGRVTKFAEHQRVSHKTDSKISCLSITWDGSGNDPESLQKVPESFRPEQGTGNREQGKEHEGGADAPSLKIVEGDLAYTGTVIRLKRDQFDRWKKAYRHIPDMTAALEKADAYYTENPPKGGKWFFPVARWLEQENGQWKEDGAKRRRANDHRSF